MLVDGWPRAMGHHLSNVRLSVRKLRVTFNRRQQREQRITDSCILRFPRCAPVPFLSLGTCPALGPTHFLKGDYECFPTTIRRPMVVQTWLRKEIRRWLRAYSRYDETRRSLVLELTPAGDDYLVHDTPVDAAGSAVWQVLSLVLQDACERLTQRQLLEQWPEDFPRPDQATIWRALKRGAEQGLILKQGTGLRNDPFRYWLPGKEDDFPPGPNASADEKERFSRRYRERFFEAIGMDPKAAGAVAAEEPADQSNLPTSATPQALPTAPSAVSMVASPNPQPHQGASP